MQDIIDQFRGISLNIWDKSFLIIFTLIVIWYTTYNMTVLSLGGIILIYGAFLTYKGQIFLSVGAYLSADACWIINAYYNSDLVGSVFISLGMIFGILATYKMKTGKMEKNLNKKL